MSTKSQSRESGSRESREEREQRKRAAEAQAEKMLGSLGLSDVGRADGNALGVRNGTDAGTASGTAPNVERFADKSFKPANGQVLVPQSDVRWLDWQLLDDNPYQPRKSESRDLNDLIAGMNAVGQLQACVVRPHPDPEKRKAGRFQLIAGHRRKMAVQGGANAGPPRDKRRHELLGKVKCDVRTDISDFEMMVMAAQENENREDLTILDRARMYLNVYNAMREGDAWIEGHKATWKDVVALTGLSYRRIKQVTDLLSLPEEMHQKFQPVLNKPEAFTLNENHGRALLSLAELPQEQKRLYNNILREEWSGAQAARLAKEILDAHKQKKANFAPPSTAPPSTAPASIPAGQNTLVLVPAVSTSSTSAPPQPAMSAEEAPKLKATSLAAPLLAPAEDDRTPEAAEVIPGTSGPQKATEGAPTAKDYLAPLLRASHELINANVSLTEYVGGLDKDVLTKWLEILEGKHDQIGKELMRLRNHVPQ